ncbi:MAG: Crp/Fnr family transcriptional regulator [Bacteroidota bacterium]|nr:Crp/Fnr family transcriptional regulator [Bacteroidota bacterium]
MNTKLLLAHIRQFIELTDEEIDFLAGALINRPFTQGELVVRTGETARYLIFVNTGYTVTYYTDPKGNDHVIRFAAPGWWTGDTHSLSPESNTPFTTKGLCAGELLLLPRLAHQQLLDRYPKFERYFRQLFQTALVRQQLRFVESHSIPAAQRYQMFQATFPGIERYLPQKYIASYLGITPEFLSKIRKTLVSPRS